MTNATQQTVRLADASRHPARARGLRLWGAAADRKTDRQAAQVREQAQRVLQVTARHWQLPPAASRRVTPLVTQVGVVLTQPALRLDLVRFAY
ncbi:hypothetical protein D8I35_18645 [Corticibacter populi]|uniref:Uncharacterized protein n=1 Tax=Corticibacter populi TaxID=1550736 RepID=A0A3M6QGP2_9BURK|nr:hypothetical protein [Corticibacter populi]RMX02227.1 hypothetical protein D8I35_18645 [Corticibacter populi]RZS29504.1 hypothetical protein EV687_3752 [Corticibacter populi]